MLFYHIRLRCYVVIELKVVDFKPEFAGKLNFYVAACNKLLRQPEDNPTIGLLLCKSKDQTKVEWAFDSIQNPMGVATYEGIKIKDKLPSVEDLKNALTWWSRNSENIKRMRRLLQRTEITHPIKKQNSCIILYFYALDNSYLYQCDISY